MLKLLVKHGADVNAADATGDAAIHYAASVGAVQALRVLVSGGADPNARGAGTPPLHLAADTYDDSGPDIRDKSVRAIDVLLEAGADPLALDAEGRRAYHHILTYGKTYHPPCGLLWKRPTSALTRWPRCSNGCRSCCWA